MLLSRVGRSTILLKPQGTVVWWKIRWQKFIDHLCVTLRRDCLRADRLGLRLTDASTRAKLSGVRNEDGRPGGFLHVTEPSSRHCLSHRRIAFGDGASCWFPSRRNPLTAKSAHGEIRSRRNPRWVSVINPVRINSSTGHTSYLTPQRSMLTKSEGHCSCSNNCIPRYPSGEALK